MILKRIASHGFWGLISMGFSLLIVAIIMYAYMYLHLPSVSGLKDVKFQAPLRVLSADGQLIAEFGTKRRIPIQINQVPKQLIQALLATEDQRFYQHEGVDFRGIARAALAVISTGRKVQGASTITMQVARNFFLSRKKSYARKINEILLAIKIEHALTKNEILTLYLNKVFFGNRAYGIAAAAHVYYGKTLDQVNLPEIAMLAGLPQAPSRNNPLNNPEQAKDRRNHVLQRLLELNDISQSEYDQAIQAPITASYHGQRIAVSAPYVAEMVRQAVVKYYGREAAQLGLAVTTTIQPNLQRQAQSALQRGLIAYSMRHGYLGAEQHWHDAPDNSTAEWTKHLADIPVIGGLQPAVVTAVNQKSIQVLLANGQAADVAWNHLSWARYRKTNNIRGPAPKTAADIVRVGDVIRVMQLPNKSYQLSQVPAVQGAIAVNNPQNGGIESLVGGFSFSTSHFNRAVQARRQAGSVFKPFVYSAALNKGYTLASIINDAPIVMRDSGENELWRPNNDNLSFKGPTRLIIGLNQSRNLVSIRLLQSIGIPYALQYIKRFGFNPNDLPNSLSLALGSASVSPLQITEGFDVFANGGFLFKPFLINTIKDANGHVIYQHPNTEATTHPIETNSNDQPPPRAIEADNAYLMTTALQSVIQQGTGRGARVLKRSDLAGKTGTTNDKIDAWFAGFNPTLCAVVWVGFDDQTTLREFGAQAALPIWIDFMRHGLRGIKPQTYNQPNDIITAKIDSKTGLLAQPGQQDALFQVFRKQYAPTAETPPSGANIVGPNTSNLAEEQNLF